jgi:hypothetical protein
VVSGAANSPIAVYSNCSPDVRAKCFANSADKASDDCVPGGPSSTPALYTCGTRDPKICQTAQDCPDIVRDFISGKKLPVTELTTTPLCKDSGSSNPCVAFTFSQGSETDVYPSPYASLQPGVVVTFQQRGKRSWLNTTAKAFIPGLYSPKRDMEQEDLRGTFVLHRVDDNGYVVPDAPAYTCMVDPTQVACSSLGTTYNPDNADMFLPNGLNMRYK